jgi:hypothetical protein
MLLSDVLHTIVFLDLPIDIIGNLYHYKAGAPTISIIAKLLNHLNKIAIIPRNISTKRIIVTANTPIIPLFPRSNLLNCIGATKLTELEERSK